MNSNSNKSKYRVFNQSEAELYIHPLFKYDETFPQFNQPIEIGSFVSSKRKSEMDSKNKANKSNGVKYLILPKDCSNLSFDLKLGSNLFVPHTPHQNGIDPLLTWILDNKNQLYNNKRPADDNASSKSKKLKIDFICWRGLLTKILATPYDKQKDWMLSIILHQGTYYLCEIETDAEKEARLNMDEKTKSFTYWGHKFESYVTADSVDDEPGGAGDVPDPENNYATVVRSKLNKYELIYGAEIDCCLYKEHRHLNDYCELKTSRGYSFEDLNLERNMKYLKWWLQSYLVDIQVIKIGLRDDQGIVNKIIDCTTSQIYNANNNRKWKPNVCFNFLKAFFDLVSTFCTEEGVVFVAHKPQNSNAINFTKQLSKDHHILRDWYTSAI